MTQKEQRKFGRPIDYTNAKRLYKSSYNIKKRAYRRIHEVLDGDDEARRFYCGRPGKEPVTDDIAYVFDKKAVEALFAVLLQKEAHGIIIFSGVRAKEDSRDDDGRDTDFDGRPTLMIFPYKYNEKREGQDEPDILVLKDDGQEHPGTGGGAPPTPPPSGTEPVDPSDLPLVFRPDQIHFR